METSLLSFVNRPHQQCLIIYFSLVPRYLLYLLFLVRNFRKLMLFFHLQSLFSSFRHHIVLAISCYRPLADDYFNKILKLKKEPFSSMRIWSRSIRRLHTTIQTGISSTNLLHTMHETLFQRYHKVIQLNEKEMWWELFVADDTFSL